MRDVDVLVAISTEVDVQAVDEEIASSDVDGECPHYGIALPESGLPTCPQCGAPYRATAGFRPT